MPAELRASLRVLADVLYLAGEATEAVVLAACDMAVDRMTGDEPDPPHLHLVRASTLGGRASAQEAPG